MVYIQSRGLELQFRDTFGLLMEQDQIYHPESVSHSERIRPKESGQTKRYQDLELT